MSYSQSTEEAVILEHCPAIGTFLDIGAYDPRIFSNTRALYERGWSGVMVEPSPEPFLNLLREYGNDQRIKLLHTAVAIAGGFAEMQASADMLSTTSPRVFERWKDRGGYYGKFWCGRCTVEGLLGLTGKDFDFMSVDIEGESADVFMLMMALSFLPKCVCVEHDGQKDEILIDAAKHGYWMVHETSENLILVRS